MRMYMWRVAACALALPGWRGGAGRRRKVASHLRQTRFPAAALARLDGVAMCFRVAMFSLHTSPLASLGRTRDAGGMNVYVRELARELGRSGIDVDIFTRRSDPNLPPMQHDRRTCSSDTDRGWPGRSPSPHRAFPIRRRVYLSCEPFRRAFASSI